MGIEDSNLFLPGQDPKGPVKAVPLPFAIHPALAVSTSLRAETLGSHHLKGEGVGASRTSCFPEKAQVKFQGQELALVWV